MTTFDATISVDGREVGARAGEMVIAATDRAGVYIPRFCYHESLSVAANCRMCLVEVEGAPKPLPACATPVADGMRVLTGSEVARTAQQGTLEFLLINHPLDCPVCDQGGECPLQDQAMRYGDDGSRFVERKRAVASADLGPLIATEMTRCIHCTRCVRFGEEVAGVMELGLPGRGEGAYIATFLGRSVDSEVSGNMIDLCPVGALTSKPYRFAARPWELQNYRGVSPHDCVGANLQVQALRGVVERVVPRENEGVNGCWLADRDRFSYEAVNSEGRLEKPMVREGGGWKAVSWERALGAAAEGIKGVVGKYGAGEFAGVAGYAGSLEEYFLLQKLVRGLGGGSVDHRLRGGDFYGDRDGDGDGDGEAGAGAGAGAFPGSELAIAGFGGVKAALLVGSNLRKEQPLLALRLRGAVQRGARVGVLNAMGYEQNFDVAHGVMVGGRLVNYLAGVAVEVGRMRRIKGVPEEIGAWVGADVGAGLALGEAAGLGEGDAAGVKGIARDLVKAGGDGVVVVGAMAQEGRTGGAVEAIARWICRVTGGRLAVLAPGNSAAAWWAGCVPHRLAGGKGVEEGAAGLDARAMFAEGRRGYLLVGTEPELDALDGRTAGEALRAAKFVVQVAAWKGEAAMGYADVLLPMAAFTETAGHFMNCEGRVQRAEAAVAPLGEARPGWKILRVLGNFLEVPGFEYMNLEEVNADIPHYEAGEGEGEKAGAVKIPSPGGYGLGGKARKKGGAKSGGKRAGSHRLARLLDMPMYRGDVIVRNAAALQRTADNPPPAARMHQETLDELGLSAGTRVLVRGEGEGAGVGEDGEARLEVVADSRVPLRYVYVPIGFAETAPLGAVGQVVLEEE